MRLGVRASLVNDAWVAGDVEVRDGRVEAVGCSPPRGKAVAVPGFVDCQVNGFAGVDLRHADQAGYEKVAGAIARTGVTTFLPTYFSSTPETYRLALSTLAQVQSTPPAGARIGGAHLEGPFLSPLWAGAHDRRHLTEPDLEIARVLLDSGPVALMTVAPELAGADQLIRLLRDRRIVVSIGHTDATAEEVHHAIDGGVSTITHCFNAHRRFSSRDPGPAAVALTRSEVTVGLIADGHHVAPDAIRLCFAAAPGRVALVTDSVAPAGTDEERWEVDATVVTIDHGRATLADGTLAGAVVPMDACVRHVIELGVDPAAAVLAASTTPGRIAGLTATLIPGAVADIAVLDDGWRVERTLVAGADVALS